MTYKDIKSRAKAMHSLNYLMKLIWFKAGLANLQPA